MGDSPQKRLFPARAGVILPKNTAKAWSTAVPRTCGGNPYILPMENKERAIQNSNNTAIFAPLMNRMAE